MRQRDVLCLWFLRWSSHLIEKRVVDVDPRNCTLRRRPSCLAGPVARGVLFKEENLHFWMENVILLSSKIRVLCLKSPPRNSRVGGRVGGGGGGSGFFTKGGAAVKDLPIKFQSRDDVTRDHQGELPTPSLARKPLPPESGFFRPHDKFLGASLLFSKLAIIQLISSSRIFTGAGRATPPRFYCEEPRTPAEIRS